jgi:HSP20 family protein
MPALLVRDPLLAAPFRLMDEFVRTMGNGGRVTGFTPPLDVIESDEQYLVLIDLPGVQPEDVTIELNEQVLTVSGSRTSPERGSAQLTERQQGAFTRSLTVPRGIDSDAVSAEFRHGVLELQIPKPEQRKPKRIPIANIVEHAAIAT